MTVVTLPFQPYTSSLTEQELLRSASRAASRGASDLLTDISCRPATATGVSPVSAKAVVAEATATRSISIFFIGKMVVKSALCTVRWLTEWNLLCGFTAVFGDNSARTGNEVPYPPRFKPGPAKTTAFLLLSS